MTAKPKRAPARAKAPPARRGGLSLPTPEALFKAGALADVVEIPGRTVLAIDGAGGPEQAPFQRSVGALYGVAYSLRFARKPAGGDFKIGPLEGRWWAEGALAASAAGVPPRETWRWRLRLGVPDGVTDHEVADVIQAATMKKGGKLEGSADARRVALERIPAATMGRVLHVGPYADEPASFERIRAALTAAGRSGGNAHLEVYLSDPRRTKPEKLKTVLLRELA
ncbi:MAG TPA: GyrI-like domain-containing protein [Anaeromyxobacteraceae bacterium]|nr:GyrI-like domain-containing protein [Anaeromyxobacteraceae bacterium]